MNDNNQPANYADYDEIDLRDIFKTLGKWKWKILGFTIGAMLLAGIYSFFFITPIYEARTVISGVQLEDLSAGNQTSYILKEEKKYHSVNENTITMPITSISADMYTELIKSPWILEQTIDKLNINMSMGQLRGMIKAELMTNTTFIEIKVSHQDPVLAQNITNTLVEQLQKYVKTIEGQQIGRVYRVMEKQQIVAQADLNEALSDFHTYQSTQSNLDSIAAKVEATKLQNTIDRKSDVVDLLNSKILELKLTRSFIESEDSIIVLSPATEPGSPVKPNKKLNVAIAGVLALMISVFSVFLLEYLREDQQI